jgi:hypothetical protein
VRRFWQYFLPLAIDLCPLILVWIIVPNQFQTPVQTMVLFAPDVFVAIVTLTVLGLGWALLRSYFTLRPRLLMKHETAESKM